MSRFEYQITRHPAETFNEVVFYCNESGECGLEAIPPEQIEILQKILNEKGWHGWELVQIAFGANGLLAFWKRPLPPEK